MGRTVIARGSSCVCVSKAGDEPRAILRMHGYIVIENWTVAGTDRIDSLHLECVALQVFHGATQYVVRFALELRRTVVSAFLGRKSICIKPVRARLIFGVLLNELNIGAGQRRGLRLIPKPAARREEDEDDDEDNHYVVRPATSLIRPENCVHEAAPELSHASERLHRPPRARRAYGGRDGRRRRPRGCA